MSISSPARTASRSASRAPRRRLRSARSSRPARRRAARARRAPRTNLAWTGFGVLCVLGASLLVLQSASTRRAAAHPAVGEHWHAALAVNVCGTWLDPAPAFEPRSDKPGVNAGLHSHGDGLMHLHPFTADEAGANATVGQFLREGGWSATDRQLALWDDTVHRAGASCATPSTTGATGTSGATAPATKARPAQVSWKAAPLDAPWPRREHRSGLAGHRPSEDEVVAVYYGPPGMAMPRPPGVRAALAHLTDVAPTD